MGPAQFRQTGRVSRPGVHTPVSREPLADARRPRIVSVYPLAWLRLRAGPSAPGCLRGELIEGPPSPSHGPGRLDQVNFINVPEKSGHGVSVDPKAGKEYRLGMGGTSQIIPLLDVNIFSKSGNFKEAFP